LFESGFEVFDDLLCEDIGVRKVIGLFKAFVPQPENIEAGLVAVYELFVVVGSPPTVRILFGPSRLSLVAVLGIVALNEFVEIFTL